MTFMELGITTGKVLGTYDNNAKVNRNILYIMQSILHNIIHTYYSDLKNGYTKCKHF